MAEKKIGEIRADVLMDDVTGEKRLELQPPAPPSSPPLRATADVVRARTVLVNILTLVQTDAPKDDVLGALRALTFDILPWDDFERDLAKRMPARDAEQRINQVADLRNWLATEHIKRFGSGLYDRDRGGRAILPRHEISAELHKIIAILEGTDAPADAGPAAATPDPDAAGAEVAPAPDVVPPAGLPDPRPSGVSYGEVVQWRDNRWCLCQVIARGYKSQGEAKAQAYALAVHSGWTPAQPWQFWRWGEQTSQAKPEMFRIYEVKPSDG